MPSYIKVKVPLTTKGAETIILTEILKLQLLLLNTEIFKLLLFLLNTAVMQRNHLYSLQRLSCQSDWLYFLWQGINQRLQLLLPGNAFYPIVFLDF